MRSKKHLTIRSLATALAFLVYAESAAHAEVYRKGPYTFDVEDVPPADIKQVIVAVTQWSGADILPSDAHPVVIRWRAIPCALIENGNETDRSRLLELLDVLDRRSGFGIEACGRKGTPSIVYHFTDALADQKEQETVLDLLGRPTETSISLTRFLAGQSVCYWRFSSGESPSIESAVVLINPLVAGEAERQQCILAATLASSGVFRPVGVTIEPVAATSPEWKKALELNLLSLFVLYALDSKASDGTRQEVNQAIGALVDQMYLPNN